MIPNKTREIANGLLRLKNHGRSNRNKNRSTYANGNDHEVQIDVRSST